MSETERQQAWADAAVTEAHRGNEVAAGLFALLALPSEKERKHSHAEHAVGFRTKEGRRGFKCGIDGTIVRWVDPE